MESALEASTSGTFSPLSLKCLLKAMKALFSSGSVPITPTTLRPSPVSL